MKRILKPVFTVLLTFWYKPKKKLRLAKKLLSYFSNLGKLKKLKKASKQDFPLGKFYPCLEDKSAESGFVKGHYFHQDLLVARRIHENSPETHVDAGSRIDGLVAHIASFRPIQVIDIRPLTSQIKNVTFLQADLMAPLKDDLKECCDSLSCLHAIEHFGLGRYGDPVNFEGHLLGLDNLYAILKKGGMFYFSVPIGPQRIEFDAHRVFSINYLMDLFEGKYEVNQFSYVDDQGDLHENVELTDADREINFGCKYGAGIFEMTKR